MSNIEKKERTSVARAVVFFAFLILSVCWIFVIFGFSSTNGEKSSSQSKAVTEKVVRVIDHDYKMPEKIEPESIDRVYDNIIRKTAHVGAYAVLGCLLFLTFKSLLRNKKEPVVCIFSVPLSVLVAIADEYNQTLTEGRMGCVSDVFIDTAGIILGTLICMLVFKHITERRMKKKNKIQ